MYKSLLFVLFSVFSLPAFSSDSLKAVEVLTPQQFLLNSTTNIGGKTRVTVPLVLPANTVRWYYSITTDNASTSNKSIQLLAQLTRLVDQTGTFAGLASTIFVPSGSASCDVYFLSGINCNDFLYKWTKGFKYSTLYTRENFISGTVEVSSLGESKSFCLGLRNNSNLNAVRVTVEVVAIVKE